MKIFLRARGEEHTLIPDTNGQKAYVSAPVCVCGDCAVVGKDCHYSADGRDYEASGFCASCGTFLGQIIAQPETIFGAREDDAVLCGRCRVY